MKPGQHFIRPYGQEWAASESILTRPLAGIKPTMIARAGALDQGNIILNLIDAEQRGLSEQILFLAGSAINSIKDADGQANPRFGAQAMMEALEIHRSGELRDVPMEEHLAALCDLAEQRGLKSLRETLRQRYPDDAS